MLGQSIFSWASYVKARASQPASWSTTLACNWNEYAKRHYEFLASINKVRKKRQRLFRQCHQKRHHCLLKASQGYPAPPVGHAARATFATASTVVKHWPTNKKRKEMIHIFEALLRKCGS